MLRFLRFIRGYMLLTVCGRFPERFLNITARNGVRLWGVERRGDSIAAAMYMSDYLRIRPLAKASGARLRVCAKRGLPVIVRRYRDRLGLIVGVFAFVITVFVMSLFVWSIDITGLETVSESELRSMLSNNGLSIGAFRPSIDGMTVSRAVMLEDERIGWMAVNITGSYVSVEVKEEAPAPDIPDIYEPCNVKAGRDGVILSIEAAEGRTMLKEGSGVVAGQLVVSGVMEDQIGGVRFVRADARVNASTERSMSFSVPEQTSVLYPTGERGSRLSLWLLGLRLPLNGYAVSSGETAVADRMDCLAPMDTALPIGVITESVAALSPSLVTLDNDSAKELLLKQAQLYEVFTLNECQVTARSYDLVHKANYYELRADYSCIEDIAVQQPLDVSSSEPDQ